MKARIAVILMIFVSSAYAQQTATPSTKNILTWISGHFEKVDFTFDPGNGRDQRNIENTTMTFSSCNVTINRERVVEPADGSMSRVRTTCSNRDLGALVPDKISVSNRHSGQKLVQGQDGAEMVIGAVRPIAASVQSGDSPASENRVTLDQQKQDIADKIIDLQSDMQEQQSEAENWDQEAQQLGDTSNCTGLGAAICVSIAQIGVNKAQAHAREAREAAQRDQEQINELQGQSGDLDQQISSVTSATAAQQPAYNPNALVDVGNQQAAQIRAIGNANASASGNNANKPAAASPGAAGQNSKWCNAQHVGVVNAGACPGW